MTEMVAIKARTARTHRFVAALCDAPTKALVADIRRASGGSPVHIIDGGIDAAAAQIGATQSPELLLVDLDASTDLVSSIEALADVCTPETRVVALGSTNDIRLYRWLLDAGIADYLVKPIDPAALAAAIDCALAVRPGGGARTVALIGSRGGVGTTALALSAGWVLARQQRVMLLDLDLHFGAMALALDTVPGAGLRDLVANPDRVDATLINAALARLDGKSAATAELMLLAGEVPLEGAVGATPAGVAALIAALSTTADTIIIDLPRSLDEVARGLLRNVDCVAIVTDQGLAGLRDTQRLLRLIAGLRAGARPLVIANRGGSDVPGQLPCGSFEAALGSAFDLEIAEDPAAARKAALRARPLAAEARNPAVWHQLAALLGNTTSTQTTPLRLLQRLRRLVR